MSIGINDNISALYRLQQEPHSRQNTGSCAPVDDKKAVCPTSKMKVGAGICSALGVMASLMLLAKCDKSKAYSINPLKMLRGNIKDSYILNKRYKTKEIVTIGAGSILGGLAGGAILDDKKNFNSKLREGVVQILNITFPIAFVEALSLCGTTLAEKSMPNWCQSKNFFKQVVTKVPATIGAISGLICGMYVGNRCSNKLNEKIFRKKDDRPVKMTDFSAHVDDIGVAATFIAPENILTKTVSRLIPAALVVAGYETGIKSELPDNN